MGIVLDPTKWSPSHPSEEVLDEYALNRLPEAVAAPIEEHLLICHSCQDALYVTEQFVSALKVEADQPVVAIGRVRLGWQDVLLHLARVATSKITLGPVFILMLLAVLAVRGPHAQVLTAPVAVSLSSL